MMKNKIQKLFFIIILITLQTNKIFALTAQEAVSNVRSAFKNAKTIKADFKQTLYNSSLKNKQIIEGILKIKKPDKLLMTYEKPKKNRQKLLIDKNKFWMYLEDSNELIKKKIHNTEKDIEKQIFPWMEEIDSFNIEILTKTEDYIELIITPRENAMEKFKKFVIRINLKSWMVVNSYMLDLSDNTNEFSFENINLNKDINDKEFDISVPVDAEILEEER